VVDDAFQIEVRAALPELPEAKRRRFVEGMGLTPYAASVVTGHPRIAAFFEEAAILHGDPVKVANFVQAEVLRDVHATGLTAVFPVKPAQAAAILRLVDEGTISGKQAKEVHARGGTDRDPADVAGAQYGVIADPAIRQRRRGHRRQPEAAGLLAAGAARLFVGRS
jgi:aspartyl-tRNA(Asn)/glutamyl-tRNA(Gln) amidotransferase subunit B